MGERVTRAFGTTRSIWIPKQTPQHFKDPNPKACEKCNKEFKNVAGRKAHQRHCKEG